MKLSSITTAASAAVAGLGGLTTASPSSLDESTRSKAIFFDLDMPERNTSDISTLAGPVHAKLYPCGNNDINRNKVQILDLVFDPYPPSLGDEIVITYDIDLKIKLFDSAVVLVRAIGAGSVLRYSYEHFCGSLLDPDPMLPCPARPGPYKLKHAFLIPSPYYKYDYKLQFLTYEWFNDKRQGEDVIACTEIRGHLA